MVCALRTQWEVEHQMDQRIITAARQAAERMKARAYEMPHGSSHQIAFTATAEAMVALAEEIASLANEQP